MFFPPNSTTIVAMAAPLLSAVGRLHGFPRLSNRGKGMWIFWRIIPIFPPQALTVGTPLTEATRIPHRGPKHNKSPPILSKSLKWDHIRSTDS
ncbi:uncharacterized protein BO87DRAFT_166320 [Aspergillus neoniger CBS 115656]|uniref:Uncharacterized protein n=1 Tax=Aspergillus neoniger (strain CBS 115656) TaxID=1448310 RepID=A0A318Z3H5_ASPNB|nr:hypothetical protein BO87DRAFT_166320 [Aspergillus neoniger CBS 115656]PYH38340.1 hypothetical protein BO87DRAFT_166320 [Aspergillus neoniger CBS 115656]